MRKIPYSKPTFLGPELENVKNLISNNGSLAGGGGFNKSCEKILSDHLGQPTLITTSCTHSLELSSLIADIGPGDEVILPSFTFVSSANAFILRGAIPRFADNDEFGNLCLKSVEKLISAKTKAICVVHYAGNSCDLDHLLEICKKHKLTLFEDAAQCIGSAYKGKPLGTFGRFGCFSFHDTKNITSGEGGALSLHLEHDLERAEIMREKGTNRSQFLMGLVDKYTWVDRGSSYILSEMNTAYLLPQLQNIQTITSVREKIWKTYQSEVSAIAEKHGVDVLKIPKHNTPNYHIFGLIFRNINEREKFMNYMRNNGISTPFHYVALHTSPFGKKFIQKGDLFENCMKFSDGLSRLPIYHSMTTNELEFVVEKTKEYFKKLVS